MKNEDYSKPRAVRLGDLDTKVDQYLSETGEKFSDFVRAALSEYLNPEKKSVGTYHQIKLLVDELREERRKFSRVGGNLNQLARHFNLTHTVDECKLSKVHDELRLEFGELIDLLQKIEESIN